MLKSPVNPGYSAGSGSASASASGLSTSVKPVCTVLNSLRPGSALPGSLMHAQETMLHDASRVSTVPVVANGKPPMTRNVNSSDGLQIPQFLKRSPG